MKKTTCYLSGKKWYWPIWIFLFLASALCISWRYCFFGENEWTNLLVQNEVGACFAFFLLALVPFDCLCIGRKGIKTLRLNNSWGVLGLAFILFAALALLLAKRISGALELRLLCFLLLSLVLLLVEAADMEKSWFLPMSLLSLGSWVLAKFLLRGGNSFGFFVALAVSVRLLSGRRPDKKLLIKVGVYLLLSIAVPAVYASLFETEKIKASIAVWQNASKNTFTWYGNAEKQNIANILWAELNLALTLALLLLTKRLDPYHKQSVIFLAALDLSLVSVGVLIWFNILPQGTLAIMPFRSESSAVLTALLANHLLYARPEK